MPRFAVFVLLVLSTAVTACKNGTAEAASATASAAVVATGAPTIEAAATKDADSKVARIVFVGKEQACDCTRKTVEAGWATLQKALGTPAKLPVETLQLDTQGSQVEPYRKMRPIMALPAIYFIDGKGGLVEMLQGEVSEAQVSSALAK
jgi:hypothetical protein